MAVALFPESYDCGDDPPDGGPGWQIAGIVYPKNPKRLLEGWEREMLQIWRLWQGGFGPGHLPDSGGSLDQAAIMLDALAIMDATERALKAGDDDRG